MSKLTKMVGLEKDTTEMVPNDTPEANQNPEAGQYDRSHKQKIEKEKDDAKAAARHAERGSQGGTKIVPKVNMQLQSGTTLQIGKEAYLSDADVAHLDEKYGKDSHHHLYEK